MGKNGNYRSIQSGGYDRSDSDSDKAAEKKKVENNAHRKESHIVNRFNFMDVFSEVKGEFFYEKFVPCRGNVSMENAGNAECAAQYTCSKNNDSYKKSFRNKRGNHPEHKVYRKTGENGSCKTEKVRNFKMSYNKGN